MILLLDNRDSFVHNLARYVRELGGKTLVRRSEELSLGEVRRLAPSHIIISPGPGVPHDAGVSTEVVRVFGEGVPILGVCLGHLCVGAASGTPVHRARRPTHGRASLIHHGGADIFAGLPEPLRGARYHSLVLREEDFPEEMEVTAWTGEGEVMGVRLRDRPVWGVQFHPESILTEGGHRLLRNFLSVRGVGVARKGMLFADGPSTAAVGK